MRLFARQSDVAPELGPRDLHESRAARATVSRLWPARKDVATTRSGFDGLTERLPTKYGNLHGMLLASALPMNERGCHVLRPLWTEEATHRAHCFMRLLDARSRRGGSARQNTEVAGLVDAIACHLAVQFRELEGARERAMVPCCAVLLDVVTGLGALFGCPGGITVNGEIEEVWLPAYKRRALVLAAVELVCNALLHAFQGRATGLIDVCLTADGPGFACLRVADNGIGFSDSPPDLACGVAAGLAGLLESDLAYDRMGGSTIAEIVFPVSGSRADHVRIF